MLSGPTMIKATRHWLRRLGLVSVLLMMLAVVLPSAEAQACAPSPDLTAAAVVVDADGCDAGLCGDCGAACTHGCCHAPHVAVPAASAPTPRQDRIAIPRGVGQAAHLVARTPDGPDRPPRG
ncbi:MAG: hypothetical protein ACT6RD_03670 [Brevundimonas sp.]|uniref:hypothetical protein n=2 Tax=Brevundimonas sp. TaxID=1871086 RepID=UPI004033B8A1